MKKLLVFWLVLFVAFGMFSCGDDDAEEEDYMLPDEITVENVDDYMDHPNMQFVDVRNFDDKMKGGYIFGFEMIPFFDYLEYEDILVRVNEWTFSEEAIKNENALRNLFHEDKNIVIICAAGTRAGFVKSALEHLGYENVWNAGGFMDYDGENKVFGDDEHTIELLTKGDYTPGVYYETDEANDVTAVLEINEKGGIQSVYFFSDGADSEWYADALLVSIEVVNNQEWVDVEEVELPLEDVFTAALEQATE
ncbi:MAG: rhodanese-like domain-containing protein [Acholeplasmataceae bacterium]